MTRSSASRHICLALVLTLSVVIGGGPSAAAQEREPPPAATTDVTTPSPAASPAISADQPSADQPSAELPSSAPRSQPTVETASLPRDLSPWGMFLAADIVMKIVMVGLVAASVLTWTVLAAKTIELRAERRRAAAARSAFPSIFTFDDAREAIGKPGGAAKALVVAAETEIAMSHGLGGDGIKERLGLVLTQVVADTVRRMRSGLGAVATVGATAPFIGLFGTVWGIMNSFIGISRAQTTNLAVVAPGIAEALLATALGLFAAIPAVVIYNATSRSIAGQRAALDALATEILRVVGRDLDRAGQARAERTGDDPPQAEQARAATSERSPTWNR